MDKNLKIAGKPAGFDSPDKVNNAEVEQFLKGIDVKSALREIEDKLKADKKHGAGEITEREAFRLCAKKAMEDAGPLYYGDSQRFAFYKELSDLWYLRKPSIPLDKIIYGIQVIDSTGHIPKPIILYGGESLDFYDVYTKRDGTQTAFFAYVWK